MLFDFHQDMLGPMYQCEGVPDWAVEQLPGSFTTLLGPPTFGFPFNYFTPQLSQAYDNLWADKGEIREGFRNAWTAVAKRSEEHTSELQSLMRISYAVFCLKKKKKHIQYDYPIQYATRH